MPLCSRYCRTISFPVLTNVHTFTGVVGRASAAFIRTHADSTSHKGQELLPVGDLKQILMCAASSAVYLKKGGGGGEEKNMGE